MHPLDDTEFGQEIEGPEDRRAPDRRLAAPQCPEDVLRRERLALRQDAFDDRPARTGHTPAPLVHRFENRLEPPHAHPRSLQYSVCRWPTRPSRALFAVSRTGYPQEYGDSRRARGRSGDAYRTRPPGDES
ncbi:hypothetical protein HRbin27_01346 [bacterium HR27]|nr:hypothetical protein HRbin27_01346 [bacterium HR27]